MFVVDSAIFQKEVRDVAEFLYILLTDTVVSRNAPALLVACNKQGTVKIIQLPLVLHVHPAPKVAYLLFGTVINRSLYITDITMAKSAKLIQQQLEKEL